MEFNSEEEVQAAYLHRRDRGERYHMPINGVPISLEEWRDAQLARFRRVSLQPPPIPNAHVPVWSLVVSDMNARDSVGRQRYGTPLQPFNGRDALRDAYEEALDLAVYLRQALYERDGK